MTDLIISKNDLCEKSLFIPLRGSSVSSFGVSASKLNMKPVWMNPENRPTAISRREDRHHHDKPLREGEGEDALDARHCHVRVRNLDIMAVNGEHLVEAPGHRVVKEDRHEDDDEAGGQLRGLRDLSFLARVLEPFVGGLLGLLLERLRHLKPLISLAHQPHDLEHLAVHAPETPSL